MSNSKNNVNYKQCQFKNSLINNNHFDLLKPKTQKKPFQFKGMADDDLIGNESFDTILSSKSGSSRGTFSPPAKSDTSPYYNIFDTANKVPMISCVKPTTNNNGFLSPFSKFNIKASLDAVGMSKDTSNCKEYSPILPVKKTSSATNRQVIFSNFYYFFSLLYKIL